MIEANTPNRPVEFNQRIQAPLLQSVTLWKEALDGKIADFSWLGGALSRHGYTWPGTYTAFMTAQEKLWGDSACKLCNGMGTVYYPSGYYYCLCSVLEKRYELSEKQIQYGSTWIRQELKGMKIVGPDSIAINQLRHALERTRAFINHPDKWLVYSGGTGTGKTRMLSAIMREWWPYALYIVASEFESRLRGYLGSDSSEVNIFMDVLKYHPMLLIDDFGIEYGTPWIQQKMDSLIEYRARESHWWERITVIATNITNEKFKMTTTRMDGISRTGSRLDDVKMVDWLKMSGVDFRGRQR